MANDSPRREELKFAKKIFRRGLVFPQSEVKVLLPPPPTFRDVPTAMSASSVRMHLMPIKIYKKHGLHCGQVAQCATVFYDDP